MDLLNSSQVHFFDCLVNRFAAKELGCELKAD